MKKAAASSLLIAVALVAFAVIAEAQQPAKIPRVGYLTNESLSALSARTEAFRQGLRQLGQIEGKNIVLEWRDAEGKLDRLHTLAVELVRLRVDVIVTAGGQATRSAKEATMTIPIVMTQDRDPVSEGFVASLARPGGNITGLSRVAPELSGKQLDLLKEIIPRLSRVAVFGTAAAPGNAQALREQNSRPTRSGCSFNRWRCDVQRILRLHSKPQKRAELTLPSYCRVLFSIHSGNRLRTSR
jgi:ABC-type uncharacterized transport system substrate-binding protein